MCLFVSQSNCQFCFKKKNFLIFHTMSISYDYKLKNHFDYLVSLKESSVNFIKTFCTNFKIRTWFCTLKHLHCTYITGLNVV